MKKTVSAPASFGLSGVTIVGNGFDVVTENGVAYDSYRNVSDLVKAVAVVLCRSNIELGPEHILFLRNSTMWTQHKAGRLLGYLDRQTVGLFETGKRKMPKPSQVLFKLYVLAYHGIDVSISEFIKNVYQHKPDLVFEFHDDTGTWSWVNIELKTEAQKHRSNHSTLRNCKHTKKTQQEHKNDNQH